MQEWSELRPLADYINSQKTMKILTEFIASKEGFSASAYKCPAGVWTIGYGFTRGVKEGDTISKEEAREQLIVELASIANQLGNIVNVNITCGQFVGLVSLAYNIGVTKVKSYKLIRELNAGNFEGAADEFLDICKAGGRVLEGLKARRKEERKFFVEGNTQEELQKVFCLVLGL